MALKNRDDLSELGNRLYLLMDRYNLSVPDDKKIDTPKKLATALYEAGLVEVKNRENFNSDEINKNNAIGSIEKKIVRHINTGKISLPYMNTILQDWAALEGAAKTSLLVLVETANKTSAFSMQKEIDVCRSQGTKVIGTVIVTE